MHGSYRLNNSDRRPLTVSSTKVKSSKGILGPIFQSGKRVSYAKIRINMTDRYGSQIVNEAWISSSWRSNKISTMEHWNGSTIRFWQHLSLTYLHCYTIFRCCPNTVPIAIFSLDWKCCLALGHMLHIFMMHLIKFILIAHQPFHLSQVWYFC